MEKNTQSPKLQEAMAKMEAIVAEYDIAAVILIHEPGFAQRQTWMSPSFSGMKIGDDDVVTFAFNPADFASKAEQLKVVKQTFNMIEMLAISIAETNDFLMKVRHFIRSKIALKHIDFNNEALNN